MIVTIVLTFLPHSEGVSCADINGGLATPIYPPRPIERGRGVLQGAVGVGSDLSTVILLTWSLCDLVALGGIIDVR
eukprot:SAG11_NODE_1109_length_5830_cov_4.525388_4_plen_76_part_00